MKGPAHGRALQSWCRLASAALVVMTLDLVVLARLLGRAVLGRDRAVSLDLVAGLVVRTVLGRERAVSLDLVAGLVVGTVLGREGTVTLDLVAGLVVGTVLRRKRAVALDLGLLVLALLVRHCSSFRSFRARSDAVNSLDVPGRTNLPPIFSCRIHLVRQPSPRSTPRMAAGPSEKRRTTEAPGSLRRSFARGRSASERHSRSQRASEQRSSNPPGGPRTQASCRIDSTAIRTGSGQPAARDSDRRNRQGGETRAAPSGRELVANTGTGDDAG